MMNSDAESEQKQDRITEPLIFQNARRLPYPTFLQYDLSQNRNFQAKDIDKSLIIDIHILNVNIYIYICMYVCIYSIFSPYQICITVVRNLPV